MTRFDRLASKWDLNPRRVKSAKNSIENIQKVISLKDKKILDYGSGTGLLSFDMSEVASHIMAMDNSKGMIEAMNQKISDASISNITTLLHDIHKDDLPKESFDVIVSAMTLHHISDPKIFLDKCATSLVKGGFLAISDLESEDGTFHSDGNDGVYHFGFDKSAIKSLCEESGFEVVFLDTIEKIEKHRVFNIFLVVAKRV
jgi:2-polyprenyl-3-methyl-5-hydroxy-6-metoxy-1,4-benzoquinol methylase